MSNGHCFNCTAKGHLASACPEENKCTKCKGRHNTVLHEDRGGKDAFNDIRLAAGHVANGAIRPIVPVRVAAGGRDITTYAMIDSAATTSAILASLADRIGAEVFQRIT